MLKPPALPVSGDGALLGQADRAGREHRDGVRGEREEGGETELEEGKKLWE